MSQQLLITITAKDGASQTFRTVGSSATSMSNAIKSAATGAGGSFDKISASATKADASLNKVGADATKAASSMDKLDASSSKAASGMADLEARATKIGAALGTAVAALAKFGAQAETQRRQVDGIRKAYGDAADEILAFTEKIQDSTKFSNEDAREAAQIAATLAQNYGFTADEVERLISVSADLASVKGIDLSDAVQRTSSAMRGEAESAEFLGLTLNQQAIDREGLTLSMSNEEAAHFRLNALLEQAAFAEGTAGEAAQTAAGQAAQLANNIQDMTTGIGAALGPLAGASSSLADMALILPVVGAGIGKFVAGFEKIPSASGAFTSLAGAINPVGLAITAAAVAGGILVHSILEQQAAAAEAEASYVALSAAIDQVGDASARAALRAGTIFQSSDTQGALGFFNNAVATINGVSDAYDKYTVSGEEAARANQLIAQTLQTTGQATSEYALDVLDLHDAIETQAATADQVISVLDSLQKVYEYNGNGAEEVRRQADLLVDSWQNGETSIGGLDGALRTMTSDIGSYGDAVAPAAVATDKLGQEAAEAQKKIDDLAAASRRAVADAARGPDASGSLIHTPDENAKNASDLAAASAARLAEKSDEAAEAAKAQAEAERQLAAELRGQLVPALDGASSGFANLAQPGEDVLDTLSRIAPNVDNAGGAFLQFADNLNDAQQALSGVLGMFDAIDALGAGASQAGDIASKLIGDPGTWSTIDDLVSNAAISQDTYNAAVQAGYDIQSKNVGIEEDLNAIRAQQLPLLDSQVTKLAAYVDGLANASAAEQQQALYLMDSANQAKVAASYSTAYAASLGEIPEDVATQIIADGSQADPILGDILESFGLIEVGADGTITVNFPDEATLDDVTASIDNLTATSIDIAVATSGADQAQAVLAATKDNLDEIDGRTATATVKVELDSATADAALAGRGLPSGESAATIKVPVEADTASFDQSVAGLSTDKTVTIKVTADTSDFDRALGNVSSGSGGSKTITLDADDNASSVIARAMQAGDAFDGQTYTSQLDATDNTGSVVAQAMQAANAYASGDYTSTLNANDQASALINTTTNLATTYAAGDYTAIIGANDQASALINTATDLATGFATTYSASLVAVDNASGTIDAVAAKLAALDGATATTYVTTQEVSSLPAKLLGGAIVPHAATGRVVQVGEAGPEAVVLPYGSMVQPSPASPARTAQEQPKQKKFTLPDVDLKEAYRRGGDSAEAFYDGLYDKAKGKVQELRGELGSTVYGSKAEAQDALRKYQDFLNKREALGRLRERGAQFDDKQAQAARDAERAANKVDRTMNRAATEVAASGTEAGEAFSTNLAAGIDLGATMDQVRALKDEFVTSMKASAGSADETANAVGSFEKEVRDLIGSLRYSSKVSDSVSDSMVDDFGEVEDAASESGEAAGENLSTGLASGAEDASAALDGVTEQMNTIGEATITPQIGVDSKEATDVLGKTSQELGQLDGDSANMGVKVDDSEWQAFLDDVDAHAKLGVTVVVHTKEKDQKKQLGGAVLADEVPHAALGRVITVGEAGPESVVLPYGSMVIPSPASAARAANEVRPALNFYAPVHIHAQTPDIYAAIAAQLTGVDR